MKIRHYSPKTLKAYSNWTRKFQSYVKNKPQAQLTVEDVKLFLTFLAVRSQP
ncbi:MAG: phage integrase N-terminal SAM-like domain-containing protein [Desulfobacterium sp.]